VLSECADFCDLATLWKRIPNLKLAVPFDEVKYSPPKKDVGISELLVVF
jgi:fungal nitric oxide reductase